MTDQVIEKARAMRAKFLEKCHGGKQALAINTTKFQQVVEDTTGFKVEVRIVKDMGPTLKGMLLRYPENKALILIADDNNECWRRWIFVKELCHLFLDGDTQMNSDALRQARCLVDPDPENGHLTKSEIAAVVAALEIMIPESYMDTLGHMINVDKLSTYAVAAKLKVPKKYVEYRLERFNIPFQTGN